MTPEPIVTREQPQTVVQAGGRVAENIVAGFSGTPSLLLIVILNISMLVVAGYFLSQQETLRAEGNRAVIQLIELCLRNNLLEEERHRLALERQLYGLSFGGAQAGTPNLGTLDTQRRDEQRRPHGGTNTP